MNKFEEMIENTEHNSKLYARLRRNLLGYHGDEYEERRKQLMGICHGCHKETAIIIVGKGTRLCKGCYELDRKVRSERGLI